MAERITSNNDETILTDPRNEAFKPTWIKPGLEKEMPELRRVAKLIPEITLDEIVSAFNEADLEQLSEEEWATIDGPDDLFYQPNVTIQQVHEKIAGKRKSKDYETDMKNNRAIPAPVVLLGLWDNPYLVGGNTRLLVSKALGIRPMVLGLHPKIKNKE